MTQGTLRPTWADIDLDAIAANASALRAWVGPSALCAVVKADGYGHGAVPVARAALAGGATTLAVALVEEGVELREAGVHAPIIVLSEPAPGALDEATCREAADATVAHRLTPIVATPAAVHRLADAAMRQAGELGVHVKVDTGMHRVGVAPEDAGALLAAVDAEPTLRLEGLCTHLAVADGDTDDDRAFTATQLRRFDEVIGRLRSRPLLHAANTAAAVLWPASRYDMVRCGIGLYGLAPCAAVAEATGPDGPLVLRPAMALRARVAAVRDLDEGDRPSYGRVRALAGRSRVATIPIGYADGVRRALQAAGSSVLIGGRRRPLAGTVTMDQIVVDCGPDADVAVGDEVTLLGRQGDLEITVEEWASMLGTIGYEVVCGIGPRVPPLVQRDGGQGAPVTQVRNPLLDAVRAEALGCTRCGLAASRTKVVFGVGDPHARLMIVGEGPGRDEDLAGEPFVGRSGKLLDRLLAEELGIDRTSCYIANVVKCRPPQNRDPRPDEMDACRPYLDQQLELIGPRVVVTLGNVATRALLRTDEGIRRMRGRVYPFGEGRDLVPTYHPAAALRSGGEVVAEMRADLIRAKKLLR